MLIFMKLLQFLVSELFFPSFTLTLKLSTKMVGTSVQFIMYQARLDTLYILYTLYMLYTLYIFNPHSIL